MKITVSYSREENKLKNKVLDQILLVIPRIGRRIHRTDEWNGQGRKQIYITLLPPKEYDALKKKKDEDREQQNTLINLMQKLIKSAGVDKQAPASAEDLKRLKNALENEGKI